MSRRRPEADRIAEAQYKMVRAEKLKCLLDEDVQGWFQAVEQKLIADMVFADITDDETRRGTATTLKIMREFHDFLKEVAADGRNAEKTIEQLTERVRNATS